MQCNHVSFQQNNSQVDAKKNVKPEHTSLWLFPMFKMLYVES